MKLNKDQAEYAASIAVIGKSGRFPKAENLNQFWRNLCDGKEAISFFTDEELLSSGVDPDLLRRPNYVKAMGIVEDADLFDARFFGFTPREAQLIDPQQRIFLECAWEALEDAGYATDEPGLVGVYASTTMSTYMRNLLSNSEILGSSDIMQLVSGNDKDYVATRVSYKFNLRGPSVCVQSACSSSLVGIHMACRSLLTYECDIALAGGVSIGVPLKQGYLYEEGGITSPDGHCRAFDARANGTIIGYGCGVVVLKRLFEAIKDGDSIQAIIRGSAVNNDGSSKVGYTAPSVDAQADVIRSALAVARVPSETVTYVEAHGTGTVLGDPIELTALSKAFRSGSGRKDRCAIGSIKSSIGHLDAAAGVAGLIKTVLTLEHKTLVPSLNFETPNPKADFDGSPFYVNTHTTEWPTNGTPRRAGVTSLGIGGTNVHVILEEAPELEKKISDRKHHLLLMSAKSQTALESMSAKISDHLQSHPDLQLSDVTYSLQVGRKAFPYRRAVVCGTLAEAIEGLKHPNGEGVATGQTELRNRPVVFMFPGGGTQYPGMGHELYQQERVFRESFDKCTELLMPILGRDLRTLVHSDTTETESAAAALIRPSLGLPAIFTTEYALAQLFRSWGIEPKSMIGHSLGEYAAACVAGVFTLPDALALVALRGKLFETLPSGAMLSLNLPEAGVTALGIENVSIAAINGPDNCVISGSVNAIEQATAILESKGIEFRRLHIEAAAHCSMVDPIVGELGSLLRQLKLNSPNIPFISNLTGTWITPEQAVDPGYWMRHLRHTVRFADGISELLKQSGITLLELGPGHTLGTLARVQARGKSVPVISSMKHPHETAPETRVLYASVGRLWLAGVDVKWKAFHAGEQCRRISLPTYPFERQRYFVEPMRSEKSQPGLLRKKPDIKDWFYVPSWKQMATWKPLRTQPEAAATWMVFTGGGKLESDFVEGLREDKHEVTLVLAGPESSAFERLGAHEFRIDPANPSHYKKLFASFPGSGPTNFAHFWSMIHDLNEPVEGVLQHAFYSLFFLAQTVGETTTDEQKNIWIMSDGLATVSQDDLPSPDKAILLGPCRTIPFEYPNLHCALIDVGTPKSNTVSTLLQCCADPPQSSFMAYRMGKVWRQCVEPMPLPGSGDELRLRQGGVYFITGGLGKIGLTLALHLAAKAKAKLVLVDLLSPPPRADWDHLLDMESTPGAMRFQINTLRNLEELQAPILIVQADVCEKGRIRESVEQAMGKFGAIHGVIHAAGMPDGGLIQFKTPAELETVLAPKVKGTRVLELIFKELDLDFFIACSSVTSVQGEFARVDNCSANAFLDSFCLNNSLKPFTRTIAIGWDAWKGDGIAQNAALSGDLGLHSERLASDLSTAEAVEVFDRILNLDASRLHVLVSTLDLDLASRLTSSVGQLTETAASGVSPELYSRPELTSIFVAPRHELERQIAEAWQSVLGVNSIGVYDNFWELGGNSLLATQVVSRLKARFHISLPLRALFEMPTIEKLGETVQLQVEALTAGGASQLLEGSAAQTAPIRRVDRKGKLPLSSGQERLWFIHQLDPENVAYNMPAAVRIQGPLEVESLHRTLQEIVRRHESLRTHFTSVDGEPQQIIDPNLSVELPVTELGHFPESEREAEVHRLAWEDARQPFDLACGPLLRANLLRFDSQDHVLVFNMHHSISDGWSVGVLVREVSAIYNNFSAGQPSPLPELDIQYADFSAWQRELLSGSALENQLEYWKRKLAGTEPLMLPIDKPRRAMQRQNGATQRVTVPIGITEALMNLGRKQGATLYMILLAAFQALLCRYTRQSDIAVGSPVAGRSRSEFEPLIGNFINTLVMRTDLSGHPDVIGLLQQVKETTLEADANQDVPFEKLVEVLLPQRDLSRSPLFQVLFGLLNMPWTGLQLGAAKMLPFNLHTGAAQFELSLVLVEGGSGIEGYIEYNTNLFEAVTIERMIGHYSLLLGSMISAPHAPILSIEILSLEERRMLLEDFNATAEPLPEKTVIGLFEERVERMPNATAVQYEEDELSYLELNERANQLAWRLRELGVGTETRVGLLVERSLEMVVGLLGVMKAGAAYVPLDPDYPPERLNYMLESSQIKVLLTQERLREQLPPYGGQVLELDGAEERSRIAGHKTENPDVALLPENLAYLIYTSGSTGRPKGVMNTHGGLLNRLLWMQEEYQLEPGDVVLQKTPFSFDVSVWEFFWPLMEGAKLVVARPGGHQDPSYLATLIGEQQVTTLHFVPSMLSVFLDEERLKQCRSIRRVVCSGEALPAELARRCLAAMPWAELHNLYGPTEAAIDVTYWKCMAEDSHTSVPIGKPIANIRVYVVDEGMEPVPAGVPGELCLGGVGLARGYWGRGDLTAERFVPDGLSGRSGERLYRTGDLARWLRDGNVEYLGRLDHQVKIRGFRIELGEIEAALQEHAGVRQAVVIVREDETGNKRLVAYVLPERESEESDNGSNNGSGKAGLRISQLREHLLGKLPEYMVPGEYVEMEELPLNHNGKVDRNKLPQPDTDTPEQEYAGPRNPTEETLCRVWQEILRRERVGIHDNFFKIGGHSLMAARAAARMRESFKVDIPLRRMFELPTIAQLAQAVDETVQAAGTNGASSHARPAIKRVTRNTVLVNVD
jgi:amino acid adenylation domain-containing protein